MVTDSSCDDIVGWAPQGRVLTTSASASVAADEPADGVVVRDLQKLRDLALPHFFSHSNELKFSRQLTDYGFETHWADARVYDKDRGEEVTEKQLRRFSHRWFHRAAPERLGNIVSGSERRRERARVKSMQTWVAETEAVENAAAEAAAAAGTKRGSAADIGAAAAASTAAAAGVAPVPMSMPVSIVRRLFDAVQADDAHTLEGLLYRIAGIRQHKGPDTFGKAA